MSIQRPQSRTISVATSEERNRWRPFPKAVVASLYNAGYSPEIVYWVINSGQSGTNKVCHDKFFLNYPDAKEFRMSLSDKVLRKYLVVRCALVIEGPTVADTTVADTKRKRR